MNMKMIISLILNPNNNTPENAKYIHIIWGVETRLQTSELPEQIYNCAVNSFHPLHSATKKLMPGMLWTCASMVFISARYFCNLFIGLPVPVT